MAIQLISWAQFMDTKRSIKYKSLKGELIDCFQ